MKMIYRLLYYSYRGIYKFVVMPVLKGALEKHGHNIYIGPHSSITYENTSIGSYSSIGHHACFMSTRAKIIIGNHVIFGPYVSIITGDHRIDYLGRYMNTITDAEKLPENDQDVVINDDVWIGSNTIILKGVSVGEGSIIAAGSVVIKDVEPYSINAGIPSKKIKDRFSEERLREHKMLLEQNKGK